MNRPSAPHLWLRIVMPGAGAIGPGKIALLRAVERERSIAAAARALDMSYRRAWLLLDETRKLLGRAVVKTHAGGAARGGATLTADGRALIAAYEAVCAKAERAAQGELKRLFAPRAKEKGS